MLKNFVKEKPKDEFNNALSKDLLRKNEEKSKTFYSKTDRKMHIDNMR